MSLYNKCHRGERYGFNKKRRAYLQVKEVKENDTKADCGYFGNRSKTVSKWETGRGFPDISYITELANIFGVSEKILLSGNLTQNTEEVGNMKKN